MEMAVNLTFCSLKTFENLFSRFCFFNFRGDSFFKNNFKLCICL